MTNGMKIAKIEHADGVWAGNANVFLIFGNTDIPTCPPYRIVAETLFYYYYSVYLQ